MKNCSLLICLPLILIKIDCKGQPSFDNGQYFIYFNIVKWYLALLWTSSFPLIVQPHFVLKEILSNVKYMSPFLITVLCAWNDR